MCLNNKYLQRTITNEFDDKTEKLIKYVMLVFSTETYYTFKNTMSDVKFKGLSDKSLNIKDTAAKYSMSECVTVPVHSIQICCKFVPTFKQASHHEDTWESGGIVLCILNPDTTYR
jgi:hypothetical protein